MIEDSIVEEIRNYRKEHTKKYDNDIKRVVNALKKKEKNSKHKFLNLGPKILLKRTGS